MAYTKKEIAIKNLIKGDDFGSPYFNDFRDDKEVVLQAVKTNGFSLIFASEPFRNNKDVVLEAVKQNRYSLHFASESIQSLCENKDPVETLERVIKAEKLSNDLEKSLAKSQSSHKPKRKI